MLSSMYSFLKTLLGFLMKGYVHSGPLLLGGSFFVLDLPHRIWTIVFFWVEKGVIHYQCTFHFKTGLTSSGAKHGTACWLLFPSSQAVPSMTWDCPLRASKGLWALLTGRGRCFRDNWLPIVLFLGSLPFFLPAKGWFFSECLTLLQELLFLQFF